MRYQVPRRILWSVPACIVLATVAGCASSPESDGGIVGTGNRVDCEALAKKERSQAPPPEECKRESGATR
jgi:hypothetical protein